MTARRAAPTSVLLVGTAPSSMAALSVLAGQIGDIDPGLTVHVGDAGALPEPTGAHSATAVLDEDPGLAMVVLAGDALPTGLIERARERKLALMLVDVREPVLSGRWRLFPGTLRGVLRDFVAIHAADTAAASALTRQVRGAVPVYDTGSLARYAPAPGCNVAELDALRSALGARPTWFAHALPSEEVEAALLAHAHALRRAHRLLMIVQPQDPSIGAALETRARDVGFVCARRSLDEEIAEITQVYIADTDDDPGLFLRLAPVAFLGGSLTQGARPPSAVMAAALGSALVTGQHIDAGQAEFLQRLVASGGARQIGVAPALGEALSALLSPETGAEAALKAWTLATEGSEATRTVARAICDWIDLNRGRE